MLVNNSVTVYHHTIVNHNDVWTKYNYSNVWWFEKKSSKENKGYDNADILNIRIPYGQNSSLNAANFSIGDIVVQGTLEMNITTQNDLNSYDVYIINEITDNKTGCNPHIHLKGE